jgi:phosphatidylserine decarboxylase
VNDRLFILLQHLAPKEWLTHAAGRLASTDRPWVAQRFIRWFIQRYQVDMSEALHSDPAHYRDFNAFFTRELRPGVRPLSDAHWLCPVDGRVSQLGGIQQGQLIQAKGRSYSLSALLASPEQAEGFAQGHFATLYLSPRDYHRIHMPCDGRLLSMHHIPGDLFSVNPVTAEGVEGLFARNERLVCWFEGPFGRFAMVLVGATIVGSIATVWSGVVTPPRHSRTVRNWDYTCPNTAPICLAKGAEMGRFQLGSTVIMVMPGHAPLQFNPAWQAGQAIRMGEDMAQMPAAAVQP